MKYPYLDKVVESRLHSNIYIYRIINTLFNHIVTIVLIYLVVATFALILGRLAASDVSCSSQIPIQNKILFDSSGIQLCLPFVPVCLVVVVGAIVSLVLVPIAKPYWLACAFS